MDYNSLSFFNDSDEFLSLSDIEIEDDMKQYDNDSNDLDGIHMYSDSSSIDIINKKDCFNEEEGVVDELLIDGYIFDNKCGMLLSSMNCSSDTFNENNEILSQRDINLEAKMELEFITDCSVDHQMYCNSNINLFAKEKDILNDPTVAVLAPFDRIDILESKCCITEEQKINKMLETVDDHDMSRCSVCSGCSNYNCCVDDSIKYLTPEKYKCKLCNAAFRHDSKLKLHVKTVHSKPKKRRNFKNETNLSSFFLTSNKDSIKSNTSSEIIQNTNNSSDNTISIKDLGKDNSNHQNNVHKQMFSNVDDSVIQRTKRTFECKFCEKSFSVTSNLKRHERIHTGSKPYKCKYCEKTFPDSSNLKRHEKMHTGSKPYRCQYCSKSFEDCSSIAIHERIHTSLTS